MSELYQVKEIEGKGFGCVATRDIKSGTLILSRGEYNVENLKLSRRCHKSCKTQPEGKNYLLLFNNKQAC